MGRRRTERDGHLDAAEFFHEGSSYRYVAFDPDDSVGPALLSPAEFDVAFHAANGESHKAIAKARGTSVHTVANQLSSVFSKLGINRRSELAHALRATSRAEVPPVVPPECFRARRG